MSGWLSRHLTKSREDGGASSDWGRSDWSRVVDLTTRVFIGCAESVCTSLVAQDLGALGPHLNQCTMARCEGRYSLKIKNKKSRFGVC